METIADIADLRLDFLKDRYRLFVHHAPQGLLRRQCTRTPSSIERALPLARLNAIEDEGVRA